MAYYCCHYESCKVKEVIYLFFDQDNLGDGYLVNAHSVAQAVQRVISKYELANAHTRELGNGQWSFTAITEHHDYVEYVIREFNNNTVLVEF